MIDEDLHTARLRARRWEELNERRTAITGLMREARRELDAAGVWDPEHVAMEEARLGAYTIVLAAVERELAEVGPAKELYEELLVREERRLTGSADPRGAELLEIRRLLAELDVELPARERATAAGLAILDGPGPQEAAAGGGEEATAGGREEAAVGFAREVRALGMTVPPGATGGVAGGDSGGEVAEVVERLEERRRELGRMRDRLCARREELLLG
ncbi:MULTISPECIES: hypothetical protein [unclassified Nonomuraea]|uniref:hypothetical protein n=1 Tax=unclassified Nonomuraea TaxID=2593643 RepID=UPI0035BF5AA0